MELRQQVARLEQQVLDHSKLESKLSTITDEPIQNAMIPLGPLAYFPGKLIHTNDITYHPSPMDSPDPTTGDSGQVVEPQSVLLSAKQARERAAKSRADIEQEIVAIHSEIEAKLEELKTSGGDGLEEGWGLNERGEVLNEEGLPMFDIREPAPEEPEVVVPPTPAPVASSAAPSQMRYLVKRGGKQTMHALKSVVKPTAPFATPSPALSKPPTVVVSAPQPAGPQLDKDAIFAQIEAEEAEEEARAAAEGAKNPLPQSAVEEVAPVEVVTAPIASTPKIAKEFLPSFASGFLARKPAAKSPAIKSVVAPTSDGAVVHEPLHKTLTATKSIYRPTPPPSAPSSRPSSPRPDRRVAFEGLPADPPSPKPKRSAIVLPPPPPSSTDSRPLPAPAVKEPFRPLKMEVVERASKPPTAPGPRTTPSVKKVAHPGDVGSATRTLGRAPKPSAAPPVVQTVGSSTLPIHTLSLSSNPPSTSAKDGEASAYELVPDDQEVDEDEDARPEYNDEPESDLDGSSDGSGFYGSEDDEEEIDIDSALDAREVALAYYSKRAGVGAGAGTGPLGGDGSPDTFDPWNQPDVPIDTNLQGKTSGLSSSSRFRTGRLESAQMIIPSLIAPHILSSDASDEEAGPNDFSKEENEMIRIRLESLANPGASGPVSGERRMMDGRRIEKPGGSISEMLGAQAPAVEKGRMERPPVVRSVGVPIEVPGNKGVEVRVQEQEVVVEPVVVESGKKMSRFKARQLGLE